MREQQKGEGREKRKGRGGNERKEKKEGGERKDTGEDNKRKSDNERVIVSDSGYGNSWELYKYHQTTAIFI